MRSAACDFEFKVIVDRAHRVIVNIKPRGARQVKDNFVLCCDALTECVYRFDGW